MIFTVSVRTEAMLAMLKGSEQRMRAALVIAVNKLTIMIQRSVKEDKLSGQVLHVRTGTLRRSINRETRNLPDGVFGIVGTNVIYGKYWEEGFDRKVGAGARGGPRTLQGEALARYFEKHPPGMKHVNARPFLRPTLDEFRPIITKELRAAVIEVFK